MTTPALIVVSDLDGTLLDHDTYSFDAARPALDRLRSERIPVVLCTSKTRAETEQIRLALRNDHPFIVENGGAVVVPRGYFKVEVETTLIQLGDSYADLVSALARAAAESGVPVRGFSAMTDAEVSAATDLPLEQARLAKQREFDEPFEVLDGRDPTPLLDAIARAGKRWTAGGRFYHITGSNDKARAVRTLVELYRRDGGAVTTVGLGDAPNDAAFLREVDVPVVIASPRAADVARQVPNARITPIAGPRGWNEAVLSMLDQWGQLNA
jgi:mannosyl-3-phosphoglycerate phosphatase